MTKLYRIFKTQLLLAVVLLSATMGLAQPLVQVPANCTVVKIGTPNGVLGPGGKVGNNGIVTMTDPYPGGLFTFLQNNTTVPLVTNTLTGWSLKGDLSLPVIAPAIQTESNAVIQPTGTPASITIMSYNKKDRPAEYPPGSANSLKKWGRSKGVVSVGYNIGVCLGGGITFEVYKTYAPLPNASSPTNIPAIVGPSCLLPSTVYTFSVDQIASDNATDNIGFDDYYWSTLSSPAGFTFDPITTYYSADKSSITFKTPANLPSTIDLKCCFGRANPFDGNVSSTHTTCVSKRLVPEVTEPKVAAPCVNTGATSFVVTIDPPSVVSGYTYAWATPDTSWSLTPTSSGTSQSVSVTLLASDLNPGTITLTVGNGFCLPNKVFTYKINRNFVAPFLVSTPAGTAPVTCLIPGTAATSIQYSLPIGALSNTTTWTITPSVPNGLSIANVNASGSIINVAIPDEVNAVRGAYVLTAKPNNGCSGSTAITLNVQAKAPKEILGLTCVDRNTSAAINYTCTAPVGATSYTWILPVGWTTTAVANNTTSPSISVTPGGTLASGVLSVVANVNGCASLPSPDFTVNYKSVNPGTITLPSCYNIGSGTTAFTIANPRNYGTYTITCSNASGNTNSVPLFLSSPLTIAGSAAVSPFNITIPTGALGNYNLSIKHTGCDVFSESTVVVPVAGNGATLVNENIPVTNTTFDTYKITFPAGTTSFNWLVNGAPFTSNTANVFITGPGNNTLLAYGTGVPLTSVCANIVVGTGATACTTQLCAVVGARGFRQTNNTGTTTNNIDGISIYPNPNDGIFSIKLDEVKDFASAILVDPTGKEIVKFSLKKGENKIQKQGLPTGIYTVILVVDDKINSQRIIIK